eukprot:2631075-Amphidinium_carterae.1
MISGTCPIVCLSTFDLLQMFLAPAELANYVRDLLTGCTCTSRNVRHRPNHIPASSRHPPLGA